MRQKGPKDHSLRPSGRTAGAAREGRLHWNSRVPSDPCSVNLGIETAGVDVHHVQLEGVSAMTKPREPAPTVAFVDDSYAHYHAVFPNVRQFEQFTHLELGLVAETKRKSLPRLAQATQADPQIPRLSTISSHKPTGRWRQCARCGWS
jgi:hypothetical protein